jgi:hypothetical protein
VHITIEDEKESDLKNWKACTIQMSDLEIGFEEFGTLL